MRPRSLAPLAVLALVLASGPSAAAAAAPLPHDATVSPPAPGWEWPVEGPSVVERPFVAPPTPYGAGHRGVDLRAESSGAVVRAATGGTIHFAGRVVDRGVVTIRSGPLLVTVEPVTSAVAAGDVVAAGDPIGELEPGHCASPCVHLGVREAGVYVSPLRWLGGLQRAVLLPLDG
ncbi:MAG: peptidoglycan DD-metalloendopeptidase family protein [Microcella sp.]|uniref:peptidoglycan DD-metalloendopeptidase family protein n=1 Tax=Microcella sp. TaxID=1913979 RepID=UPI002720D443|nr:peptidoglycan DD-metalloendopeptidase family protein [Microcella sp.]MDO8338071.1 peptidoglycan DD-metalloendopeptidase family protein [Microcella sp.]